MVAAGLSTPIFTQSRGRTLRRNVAADLGADLIVVGAQGQRGAGFFLGTVTTRLASTSTRCGLIVPAPPGAGHVGKRGLP